MFSAIKRRVNQTKPCHIAALLTFIAAIYALFARKEIEFSRPELEGELGTPLASIEDIQKFYNIYCSPKDVNISTASNVFLLNDHLDIRDLLSEPLTTDTLGKKGDVIFLEQHSDTYECLLTGGVVGGTAIHMIRFNNKKFTCQGWDKEEHYAQAEVLVQQLKDTEKQRELLSAKLSTKALTGTEAILAKKEINRLNKVSDELEHKLTFEFTIIRNRNLKEKIKERRKELRAGYKTFYSMGAGHFYKVDHAKITSDSLNAKPFKAGKPPAYDGRHKELRTFLEEEHIEYCALQPKTHARKRY